MLAKLVQNHTLTNLAFVLLLVAGWISYTHLPREQDPSINFNWVQIWAYWPGATASDVERRVTNPLEEGLKNVADLRFVSSTSREGVASIVVRFEDLNEDDFDKRMIDLRRELQAKQDRLPAGVRQPDIFEISSSKTFPMATIVISGSEDLGALQSSAKKIIDDIERIEGVDDVLAFGDRDAELQIEFYSERLLGLGISAVDLADTVRAYYRDLVAGDVSIGDQKWLIRLSGTDSDPAHVGKFPIISAEGEVLLRSIARINRTWGDAEELVNYQGKDAVLIQVFKKPKANNLRLLDVLSNYITTENSNLERQGVRLFLLDDQTEATRSALEVMENNALIGLLLVMLSVYFFLGYRIAFFTTISIPFVLGGVFVILFVTEQTLNVTVLLAIVISLGMLVDDAVVIVEGINHHMNRGLAGIDSVKETFREVGAPVFAAVLTTIAAFLPLMLLPGMLGDFMRVVPLVVSVALLISLIKAFWILPSHVIEFQSYTETRAESVGRRQKLVRRIRSCYTRLLLVVIRSYRISVAGLVLWVVMAIGVVVFGLVRVDFFATDFFRLFYINIEMPAGTSLNKTNETLVRIKKEIEKLIPEDEIRGIVSYAGQQATDQGAYKGPERGQIFVSLNYDVLSGRSVDEVIEPLREAAAEVPGPRNVSFLKRRTGPPTSKAISIKVRGDDIEELRRAVVGLRKILRVTEGISDISDDDTEGGMELGLQLDPDAIVRAGQDPVDVARALRLFADGEIVASTQYRGRPLDVRVRAKSREIRDIDWFLNNTISLKDGTNIPLDRLVVREERPTVANIRHYNFRRAVTVEAEIDTKITDTLSANNQIQERWLAISDQFPGVRLDFSGELDDIQDSLNAMLTLFTLGLGLVYLILATQFKSYIQPLIVLLAVPMAFIGVVFGLLFTGNPLSLYTIYGAIALAGIAANDAIVLISTANRSVSQGCPHVLAVVRAAKRRFVPIIITSVTTIAGLLSLALGIGGESLMWGPVATAIVFGLVFSTGLTLLIVPLFYLALYKPANDDISEVMVYQKMGFWHDSVRALTTVFGIKFGSGDPEMANALRNEEDQKVHREGMEALREKDWFSAIRCFEWLAKNRSEVKGYNIHAANVLIMFMQREGWDIGYRRRLERYINKIRQLDPEEPNLVEIERQAKLLDEQADIDS